MASCVSPPKKRPKLSLKLMRKDRQALAEQAGTSGEGTGWTQGSSNGRNRQSTLSNGPSATGGSQAASQEPSATDSGHRGSQQEAACPGPPSTSTSSSSSSSSSRPSPVPFAGLQNLGNTCYLNSVLQALRFCPGFCRGLASLADLWEGLQAREAGRPEEVVDEDIGREMQFVVNLNKLYETMTAKEVDFMDSASGCGDVSLSLSPDEVLESVRELNPMFQGFLQHDSQELLCCLLSYVLEACQFLRKRLVKSRQPPPPQSSAKGRKLPLNAGSPAVDDPRASVTPPGSGSENLATSGPPSNGKLDVKRSSGTSDAYNHRGSFGNGMTCQVSSGKVNGGQTKIAEGSPSPGSGKCLHSKSDSGLSNGCSDTHSPRPAEKKAAEASETASSTPGLASATCRQPPTSKKKRLGKYRHYQQEQQQQQTTLMTAFAPRSKELSPLNGLRRDLTPRPNETEDDLKSPTANGVADVPSNHGTAVPDQMESAKTSPVEVPRDIADGLKSEIGTTADAMDSSPVAAAEEETSGSAETPAVGSPEADVELVRRLFQGALLLRTRCNECESYTERREEFQDVSLPVRSIVRSSGDSQHDGTSVAPADLSLSWAISEFACVERLTDDNKYFCEQCRHHSEAERSMLFGELPPVLTIHLKRFSAFAGFLTADSTVSKVNDHLATPLSLRLSQWCAKQCKQLHSVYGLCAVVMHSGVSSSSGHYISYVQIPNRSQGGSGDGHRQTDDGNPHWGKFDDEKVCVLSQQEMAASVLHPVSSSGSAATPYLLFYKRVQEAD